LHRSNLTDVSEAVQTAIADSGVPFANQSKPRRHSVHFHDCLASAENPKNELGLLLGATVTPHLNSALANGSLTIGTGTTFQLNYARQLMSGQSVGLYAGELVLRF